jgi:Eco29kI restriction endonuclease
MTPLIDPGDGENYHADFRLSITRALGDQLADALEQLGRTPLCEANLDRLHSRPGVYQLFVRGEPKDAFVYVGKAEKSLPLRLRQHLRKLSARENISTEEILFSCLYVAEDFSALAPERLLISHYKQAGKIPWNSNGFGNRDPGRNRDNTAVKANHFDKLYPADLNREVEGLPVGVVPVRQLSRRVKKGLPFTFRYSKKLGEIVDNPVTVTDANLTADEAFSLIAQHLPEPWQIAALPGYVIMYPDSPHGYPSALRYYRGAEAFDATPVFADPGEIEEDYTPESDGGEG